MRGVVLGSKRGAYSSLEEKLLYLERTSEEELLGLMRSSLGQTDFYARIMKSTVHPGAEVRFLSILEKRGLLSEFLQLRSSVRFRTLLPDIDAKSLRCVDCGKTREQTPFRGVRRRCAPCSNILWQKNQKRAGKPPKVKDPVKRKLDTYGVDYEEMFRAQKGKCAICKEEETRFTQTGAKWSLCVDHFHVTGRVRRLLCFRCNAGLGFFRDRPDLLESAAVYLRSMVDPLGIEPRLPD